MPVPVNAISLKRRKILSGMMKLLVFIGFIFISIPFFSSLTSSSNSDNKQNASRWIASVALNELVRGEIKTLSWSGGDVWIYFRTEKELRRFEQEKSTELRDVDSKYSDQPKTMTTAHRSFDRRFFVFIPQESQRRCQVALSGEREKGVVFTEPCFQAKFDLAGRLFNNSGHKQQQNLAVPNHIIEDGIIKVAVWTAKL